MQARYAVVGNPIKHSKSPVIHQLFAQQFDEQIQYERILIEPGHFSKDVHRLIDTGISGLNVTVPFKLDALSFASQAGEEATIAGAANTLSFKGGDILANNTDGAGLVTDLIRLVDNIDDKRILLIGAGGATRGVVYPLFQAGAGHIQIANRNAEKAKQLALLFGSYGSVLGSGLDEIKTFDFDLVINCTSSSMNDEIPAITSDIFAKAELAYDMFYRDEATSFMNFAKESRPGIKVSDGLGMLVGQAAESYYIWRDKKPDIVPVIQALKTTTV